MSFTTEQKLAVLRVASHGSNLTHLECSQIIPAIIADLEHLPALVEAADLAATALDHRGVHTSVSDNLLAALAHFTEAGGQG